MLGEPEPHIRSLRARERHRRVALSAVASGLAKAVSIVAALVSVPVALSYLGVDRYGLWMTITSLSLLLSFTDMGVGNGLLNAIAEADGKGDTRLAHRYVSTAFFMLTGLAVGLGLVCALIFPWVPWPRVFNVISPQATAEAGASVAVFLGCTLIGLPLSTIQRIQLGYQEGFSNSLWQISGTILGLLGLLAAIQIEASLPWLVLSVAGGPLVATLFQTLVLFRGRYQDLRPRWSLAARHTGQRLASSGLLFFVLQLAGAVAFASDAVVAAQIMGADAVAEYAVAARLFSLPGFLVIMAMAPLWPAYREAIVRGDSEWVRVTLRRSLLLSILGATLPAIALVAFGAPLILWWAGPDVVPTQSLLAALGLWTVVQAGGTSIAMFLNGANVVKAQVVCASLMAVGALVLKIPLTIKLGLPGVVWGTVAAYLVFVVLPYFVIVPRLLSTLPRELPEHV